MNSENVEKWKAKLARDQVIAGWFGLAATAIALLIDAYYGWPI